MWTPRNVYYLSLRFRISWSQASGGHTTEFNNTPLRLTAKRTLDCQFGKQYYKDKPRKSSRMMIQGSRKLGCPAHIIIKVYETFPGYAISEREMRCSSAEKVKLKQVKSAITNKENIQIQNKYFTSLPAEEAHMKTYPTRAIAGAAQKINPVISKKIESLVREGTVDGYTIQRVLKVYVNTTMKDNPPQYRPCLLSHCNRYQ